MHHKPPRIGLALGSGSARGWSHIGVIPALERAGIVPHVVCGTSIGALVGAAYSAGEINRLEPWVRGLKWQSVVGLLDWKMGGGLMAGAKLTSFFAPNTTTLALSSCPWPLAAWPPIWPAGARCGCAMGR